MCPFFDAFFAELDTLSSEERKFVRVEKFGTHMSNFDWGDLKSEARQSNRFLLFLNLLRKQIMFEIFFDEVAIPNCKSCGIDEPLGPSFFGTLVGDNKRARYGYVEYHTR
jgi:hypothetical protein